MSDATPTDNGSHTVFRLIYRSHSRVDSGHTGEELAEIFTTARRNNKQLDITGALVVTGDAFAQALEGDENAVRDLYGTISADPRHEDVTLLQEETVDHRAFGRWAMAKVSESGGPDFRLMANASKGQIVQASPDGHVTPEQETVLAFMRSSIAPATL